MVEHSAAPVPPSMADHPAAWITLTTRILQHSAVAPEALAQGLAVAPHSPAMAAASGLMLMLSGRREAMTEAAATLRAAERALGLAASPSDHDAAFVRVLALWRGGRPSAAAAVCDAILERWPADAMALKIGQAIRFIAGDTAGMLRSAAAAAPGFADDHPHAGYVHGCHAFALEETLHFDEAVTAGQSALRLAADDAWGLHALAHVHEMTGTPHEGRALIAAHPGAYAGCSTFRHHVDWHAALFEMELGDLDAALALYDTAVRAEPTDDYRDIANAVSLLARLEGEGVDVGGRWEELADLSEKRAADACLTFADLHYLMALLAAGRDAAADAMVDRLAAKSDGTETGDVAYQVGSPAAAGLAAFRRGRFGAAVEALTTAQAGLSTIGGSHAQRDVFVRITIDAAMKAGHMRLARRLIRERGTTRGMDSFAITRLAKCSGVTA